MDKKNLVINRYWLPPEGPSIGYGVHKYYRLACAITCVVIVAGGSLAIAMHGNPLFLLILVVLAWSVPLFAFQGNGWYELAETGEPKEYLSRQVPPGIRLKDGMNFRTFLSRKGEDYT